MLAPDTILQGRYRVIRQLGQGGMGTVFEAVDQRLDTTVALKQTLFADERLRKQFEREARLLARLHHPALPRVSDHFSEGEGQFLVMQYIGGEDLAEMIARRKGPFPVSQVLSWADQLLDALDYLHTQDPQIIHRDIKPQNLKQTARGQIILLDFGLAKGQASEVSRVTTSASIFGYTPNYAPLEQVQGLGTDPRSDIYSLSATLYHLLTATKPPDALSRAAAIINGQTDPLVPTNQINAEVTQEVGEVLHKAMAQNREHRHVTAAAMRRALHGSGEVTVTNRSEADTVLFPSGPTVAPPATVANQPQVSTLQAGANQPTAVAGESTVVKPLVSAPRRGIPPYVLAVVAVLALCVVGLGFYAYRNRNNSTTATAPPATPSPSASASASPSEAATGAPVTQIAIESKPSPQPKTESAAVTDRASAKKDRAAVEKEKAASKEASKRAAKEETREPDIPEPVIPDIDVPETPVPGRRGQRRRVGGVTIRTFPDGSQLITAPNGSRVLVRPDGTQELLSPGKKRNRQRDPEPPQP